MNSDRMHSAAEGIVRYWAPLLVAAVMLVAGWLRAAPDTVDDAFISFRAVENFVRGDGLSFNAGTRVEAFSNPLMVALMIPAAAVGVPLEIAAQLLGITSFIVCIIAVAAVVRRGGGDQLFAVIGGCGVALSFPLLYYSVTGLETGLFAALIIAAVWRFTRAQRIDLWGGALWFAVAWCRPEGPAYLLAFLALALVQGRGHLRREAVAALLLVAAVFAGFLLRRVYYGLWLPNTFYAKPPGTADLDPASGPIAAALSYLLGYVLSVGVIVVPAALLQMARDRRIAPTLLLAAMVGTGFAFAVYTGGDWFPAWRYLQPITPSLIALGALGANDVARRLGSVIPRLVAAVLYLSLLAGSLFQLVDFHLQRNRYPYHVMNSTDSIEAGIWLRQNLPPGAKVAAFRIGAIGYYSGHHIVDLFGLADHDIARIIAEIPDYHPRPQMANNFPAVRDYVAKQNPEAVMAVFAATTPIAPRVDLYGNSYVFEREFPQGADQRFLLYVRDSGF